MKELALNIPINSVSFGVVSTAILREFFTRQLNPCIFPIGGVDMGNQKEDKDFNQWLQTNINKSIFKHNRKIPSFKLWHCNGLMDSFSAEQLACTFIETDALTQAETNILNNQKTMFATSNFLKETAEECGVRNVKYLPLGFDSQNFYPTNKKYFDDTITFLLAGKAEHRKRTEKIIKAWVKKFGSNRKFRLHCAIYNNFYHQDPQQCNAINRQFWARYLDGKNVWNVAFLEPVRENAAYNDILNSANIVLALSGGEGRDLPAFHSVGLGKHCVGLNAHAYQDYLTPQNAVLIRPNAKIKAVDNMFFRENEPFSQGNFFDFDDDEAIAAMEEAVKRFETNPLNTAGLELQKITYKDTVDTILNNI